MTGVTGGGSSVTSAVKTAYSKCELAMCGWFVLLWCSQWREWSAVGVTLGLTTHGAASRAGPPPSLSCSHFCLIWPWPDRGRNCLCFSALDLDWNLRHCDIQRPVSIMTRLQSSWCLPDVTHSCHRESVLKNSPPLLIPPSLSRKWMMKSPPSLSTTDPVCAKLALQEMMLHVLCSPPLLDVPGIRYGFPIKSYKS